MRHRTIEERYQTLLEANFYKILRDRETTLPASFLLVYLRGLASYYGKPDFYWKDSTIFSDLPCLSKRRLYNARHELKVKGLIEYKVNRSRYVATSYIMLDTIVADIKTAQTNPYSSGAKNAPVESKNRTTASKNRTTQYKNKDKEIERIRIPLDLDKMHKQTTNFMETK